MCNINDHQMIYDSWDMEPNRHKFLLFLTIFCCFTLMKTWKIKILKKWKKTFGDIILHKCTKNQEHMLHCCWDTTHDGYNFYFSFWDICPFTPLKTQKMKIIKNEKKTWRYHHFTYVYQKLWSHDVQFLRYCEQWRDRQTEKVTYLELGVPHKNIHSFQLQLPIYMQLNLKYDLFCKFVSLFKYPVLCFVWFKKLLNKLVKKSLSNPADIYLFNVKNRNVWNLFKVQGSFSFWLLTIFTKKVPS